MKFNLEQAIAEWRQRMLAAGVKSPVPLEELEEHLREEVDALLESGKDPETALKSAIKKIGDAQALKAEFLKSGPKEKASKWQRILEWGAALCFIPWVTHYLFEYSMSMEWRLAGVLYVALLCFLIFGNRHIKMLREFLPVIANERLRLLIMILCIACVFSVVFYADHLAEIHKLSDGPRRVLIMWAMIFSYVFTQLMYGFKFVAEQANTSTES